MFRTIGQVLKEEFGEFMESGKVLRTQTSVGDHYATTTITVSGVHDISRGDNINHFLHKKDADLVEENRKLKLVINQLKEVLIDAKTY